MSNTIRPQTKVTVVEEGTEFKGTLTSSCPIDVRGRVEGELATPVLTVSATGAVHGRAKVGEVRSLGEISGEFDADRIELAGVVRDNTVIRARSLDVKLASERGKLELVFGECELSVGDDPRAVERVEPPAAVVNAVASATAEPAAPMPADSLVAAVTVVDAPAAAEAPLASAPAAESAALEAAEDEEESDTEEAADAQPAQGGKRKRRRKDAPEEKATGWSHPPSQPPPAN